MNKNEQSIIALPDASLIILQVNKQLGIVKTILENERKNYLDKNKKSTFDLTSYADHYYSLGLNVTCISNERNQFNHLCKNLLKNPNHEYVSYFNERQSKSEFDNLSWDTCVGIGTVANYNYDCLLAIDIDGCQDYTIVEQILDILEIEYNYEWIVESGSRKGFHIIVKSNRDFVVNDFAVITCKPNEKYHGKFEKIEILLKTHIVLPPSLHISGNHYKFINCNKPNNPPFNVKHFDLEKIKMLFSGANVEYGYSYDDSYFYSGYAKYNSKDYKGAILDYDKAIEQSAGCNSLQYINRGAAKYALEDYLGAILDYDKAIELGNYTDAFYNRGLAKYKLKNYEDAIIDFTQAIQSNPNYTNAYNERGHAKYALEDYQGAILDYEKAIELNPNNKNAYHNRGNAKYALDDYEGAIMDYNIAIMLMPDDVHAFYNRGLAKYILKNYEDAIIDFTQAIQTNPNYTNAYNERGDAKYALEDYQGAILDYEKAIELNSDNEHAYNNRGNAKYALEDYSGAILDYNIAIEINPNDASTYHNRGDAKYALEDYEGAILEYNKAIELNPNSGIYFWNRGLAYEELNELKNAKKDWQKAADLGYVDAINEMKEYST